MKENEISMLSEKYMQMLRAKFTEDQAYALMSIWAQAVSLHPEAVTKTDLKIELEKLETKMMNHFRYIYAGGGLIITGLFAIIFRVF